jgi:hypothetical protein
MKWEYMFLVEKQYSDMIEKLNDLGSRRWEAVGIYTEVNDGNSGDTVILLRRQKA